MRGLQGREARDDRVGGYRREPGRMPDRIDGCLREPQGVPDRVGGCLWEPEGLPDRVGGCLREPEGVPDRVGGCLREFGEVSDRVGECLRESHGVPDGVVPRFSTCKPRNIRKPLFPHAPVTPEISLRTSGGQVEVVWNKGMMEAVEIQKDSGSGWQFLAMDTRPNYTDTTPFPTPPAVWKYRAIYTRDSQRLGQWSNIAEISVGA